MPQSVQRLVDFLGELGQRWGLPARACRVHGYLYLIARPVSEPELGKILKLDRSALTEALGWLSEYGLVARVDRYWRTDTDPWSLMLRALDERRQREVDPTLSLLRECYAATPPDTIQDRTVRLQVGKLLALVEDLAAIDVQTRRLPPHALRQLVGVGGRAARFLDRAFGRKDRG